MFVYMTKPGDTYAKVAKLFYGAVDDASCQKLRDANHDRLATRMMGHSAFLIGFMPLMIPDYDVDICSLEAKQILNGIEFMDGASRQDIAFSLWHGHDMHHALGVARVLNEHNQKKEAAMAFAGVTAREVSTRISERVGQPAEQFSQYMEILDHSALNYKNVLKSTSDAETRRLARNVYKTAHKEAIDVLHKAGHFYGQKKMDKLQHAIRGRNKLLKQVTNKGLILDDIEDLGAFESIGKFSGYVGKGFVGAGIALSGLEVYETAEEGGDWVVKLIGVSAECAVSIGVGNALLF